MKIITTVVMAAALCTPLALTAAGFEGKVTMKMTGPRGNSVPMTFSLKPGFARVDMEGGGRSMGMITDQAKQQITMLMPEQRMYMVRPLPKTDPKTDAATPEDVTVEKTDQHEKILGYDATKYISKGKQGTSEVWVTDQLGSFPQLNAGGPAGRGGRREIWEHALSGKDAFPLRVVTTSADGKETFRLEATNVEKASLPDSVFAPPADFQEMNMEKMMGGMRPPGGARPPAPPPAPGNN
jgi:hypothetical protein